MKGSDCEILEESLKCLAAYLTFGHDVLWRDGRKDDAYPVELLGGCMGLSGVQVPLQHCVAEESRSQ